MNEHVPRLRTVLWRGMRKRCPQCGRGLIYKGWTAMHDHCSECGLKYLADQGDLWAYLLVIDRALFIFPFVVLIYFRLNNPDSPWFYVFSVVTAALFVGTLPHRNGMGLGLDYLIRRKWGDLADQNASQTDRSPEK